MTTNILLNCDSYKASHFNQYPPGTSHISSYVEARAKQDIDVVFFGLQMFIMEHLMRRITQADVFEAEGIFEAHGEPFNRDGWNYILHECNGYLPLRIESLPEGMVVKPRIPLVQVRNTSPVVPWLTSYMETAILRAVWYPTTIATISREAKKVIKGYLDRTCDNPDAELPFKLHDFGARGCTSMEQAGIGGAAHLVNFMGTDTVSALVWARKFYAADMPAFSVPASEHSTMTSWGRDNEVEAYRNMLRAHPTGIVSIVADSYDFRHAVDYIFGEVLRKEILARDGTLVIRPDSGDPVDEVLFAVDSLGSNFGFTINQKGFKVLNPKVRVLQGDGIDVQVMTNILTALEVSGWSAENVVFGMGGGLLQKVNRDTLSFAMKCSAACGPDGWYPVQKDPKTDPSKQSKKGIQQVIDGWGSLHVGDSVEPMDDVLTNLLRPVYEMKPGMSSPEVSFTTFDRVRSRAALASSSPR
jgi:nicotinamide phosphoribosyltransferase